MYASPVRHHISFVCLFSTGYFESMVNLFKISWLWGINTLYVATKSAFMMGHLVCDMIASCNTVYAIVQTTIYSWVRTEFAAPLLAILPGWYSLVVCYHDQSSYYLSDPFTAWQSAIKQHLTDTLLSNTSLIYSSSAYQADLDWSYKDILCVTVCAFQAYVTLHQETISKADRPFANTQ